ncbi:MAG: hypothetical protein V1747_01495 [Candidatus Omnitrophota bacterium]
MKLFGSQNLVIKNFISFYIFILFCLILNTPGICQIQKLDISGDNQEKAELSEGSSVNVVPYTNGSSESLPLASDTKGAKLEQTVKGLNEAGYSLDEITTVLKNDNNEASVICIACLKQGFNGDQVFKSLIKAGFSKSSSEASVPAALRSEGKIFSITTNSSEAINPGLLKNNSRNNESVMRKDINSAPAVSAGLEVPVSVGITFNGLGNWGAFQDNRFKSEK